MSNQSNNTGCSLTLSMFLVLFVGLKLTGHIDWSWWWVTAPLWAPLLLGLMCLAVAGAISIGAVIADERKSRRNRR